MGNFTKGLGEGLGQGIGIGIIVLLIIGIICVLLYWLASSGILEHMATNTIKKVVGLG